MRDLTVRAIATPRVARLPLAFLAGLALAMGAAPYELWAVALLGLVGAFWIFIALGPRRRAFLTGWAVGFGYFVFSLGWITEPFQVDAAVTGWMAPFALVLMAAGLGLFWGAAFWAAARSPRPLIALVVLWCAAEMARGYLLTGFPWGMVGYLWAPVPAIQWVSVVGSYGLTFLTLDLAAVLAVALHGRDRRMLALGAAGFVLLLGGGLWLTPAPQDLSERPVVRLVQPNAPQDQKWNPEMVPVFFDRQLRLTGQPVADGLPAPSLVVWPETALPWLLHRAREPLDMVSEAAGDVPVALGIQRRDEDGRYYNSMVLMQGDGSITETYDKHHLVPFGEYMPAASLFAHVNISGLAQRAASGYSAGPGPQLIDLGVLGTALPLICYEAVFPQDVGGAPGRADLLLHLTNDAWFGTWSGPYQHLSQSRIRAIEQRLPMLRAANTGVSAVIDGGGRVIAQRGLGEAGVVDARVPPPMAPSFYATTGDLPFFLLLLVLIAAVFVPNGRIPIDPRLNRP